MPPPYPNSDYDANLHAQDVCTSAPAQTSVFMEAVLGDQGLHERYPPSVFWNSPDIRLNFGTVEEGQATGGVQQDLRIRPHHPSECQVPGSPSRIKIDVWVCVAFGSLPPIPIGSGYVHQIPGDVVDASQVGPNGLLPTAPGADADGFDTNVGPWTPPTGITDPMDPQGPGHHCIVARSYPNSIAADPQHFHVPDDPHYALKNINIKQLVKKIGGTGLHGDPLGPDRRSKMWEFPLAIGNRHRRPERIRFRLLFDPKPAGTVRDDALRYFRLVDAPFERTTNPPRRFRIDPKGLPPGTKISDHSSGGLGAMFGRSRAWDATMQLRAGEFHKVKVQIDAQNLGRGDALFLHGLHVGSSGRVECGITYALVMT
jgi:hypothetical protein